MKVNFNQDLDVAIKGVLIKKNIRWAYLMRWLKVNGHYLMFRETIKNNRLNLREIHINDDYGFYNYFLQISNGDLHHSYYWFLVQKKWMRKDKLINLTFFNKKHKVK